MAPFEDYLFPCCPHVIHIACPINGGQVELAETGPSMQIATVNVTGRFMVKFQDLDEQRTKGSDIYTHKNSGPHN